MVDALTERTLFCHAPSGLLQSLVTSQRWWPCRLLRLRSLSLCSLSDLRRRRLLLVSCVFSGSGSVASGSVIALAGSSKAPQSEVTPAGGGSELAATRPPSEAKWRKEKKKWRGNSVWNGTPVHRNSMKHDTTPRHQGSSSSLSAWTPSCAGRPGVQHHLVPVALEMAATRAATQSSGQPQDKRGSDPKTMPLVWHQWDHGHLQARQSRNKYVGWCKFWTKDSERPAFGGVSGRLLSAPFLSSSESYARGGSLRCSLLRKKLLPPVLWRLRKLFSSPWRRWCKDPRWRRPSWLRSRGERQPKHCVHPLSLHFWVCRGHGWVTASWRALRHPCCCCNLPLAFPQIYADMAFYRRNMYVEQENAGRKTSFPGSTSLPFIDPL